MPRVTFAEGGTERSGYLALPAAGQAPGVLLLHAWWGLNDFFKATADRLAAEGFTVFAPDLFSGQIAQTPDEAQKLADGADFRQVYALAEAALHFLQSHPATRDEKLAAIGFSFGAAYAVLLDRHHPGLLGGVVLFYGGSDMDLNTSQSPIQAHFAENDPWEPLEAVKAITAANVEVNIYPNTGHWFMETDQPQAYATGPAALAWQRTLAFLRRRLG